MRKAAILAGAGLVAVATGLAFAQDDGAGFAGELWAALESARMVGPDALGAAPYPREGEAHPATLVVFEGEVTVGGVAGLAIVKRGYADDATRAQIIGSPNDNLVSITVMFQREAGYDAENQDWFWAAYSPAGEVGMMEDTPLAGRVGMCIGCHANAEGGDYVFLHDGIAMR